jgi:hypothetical protein
MIVFTVELARINSDKLRDGAECAWHLGGRKMSKSVLQSLLSVHQLIDRSSAVLRARALAYRQLGAVLLCCDALK